MKQYCGAVLFIDMLGIGALTRGNVPLTEVEHISWNVGAATTGRHQLLGAKLLMQFRRSLVYTQKHWPLVKVAQLSDSAFLWSSDPVAVANATREVMWHATRAGLLCRAGLAYGQIVEPNKVNRSLGSSFLVMPLQVLSDSKEAVRGLEYFATEKLHTRCSHDASSIQGHSHHSRTR